jgi:hypothetical protein
MEAISKSKLVYPSGNAVAFLVNDAGFDGLPTIFIGNTNDSGFSDGGMAVQHFFDSARIDVIATGDNQFFEAVTITLPSATALTLQEIIIIL